MYERQGQLAFALNSEIMIPPGTAVKTVPAKDLLGEAWGNDSAHFLTFIAAPIKACGFCSQVLLEIFRLCFYIPGGALQKSPNGNVLFSLHDAI